MEHIPKEEKGAVRLYSFVFTYAFLCWNIDSLRDWFHPQINIFEVTIEINCMIIWLGTQKQILQLINL